MLEALLNRGSLPVLEQVSAFTELRHQVLVNNISNVDTVDYKMQDLPLAPFQEALRTAVELRDRRGGVAVSAGIGCSQRYARCRRTDCCIMWSMRCFVESMKVCKQRSGAVCNGRKIVTRQGMRQDV